MKAYLVTLWWGQDASVSSTVFLQGESMESVAASAALLFPEYVVADVSPAPWLDKPEGTE